MNNDITLFVFNASAQYIFFFVLLIPILILAVYFCKSGQYQKYITFDFWQYRKLLLAILVTAVLVGASSFVVSGQRPGSIIGVIATFGVILVLARRNFQLKIPLAVRFVGFVVCLSAFTIFLYWVTWGSVFFEIKFNRDAEAVTVVYYLPQREVTLPLRHVNVAIQPAAFPQYEKNLQIYLHDETNGKLYRSRQFKPRYKQEIETAISPVLPDAS